MELSMDDMPMIGQVNKNLFWSILLVALLALTGMVTLASRGAIAMAATIPVPFVVQNGTLIGSNFRQYPGISQADKATPVAISQLNATITDMVITKQFSVFGHTITMKLSAGGSGSSPVVANGLTMDATSLSIDSAQFSNMSLSAGGNGGLETDASSVHFKNATINSPYLLANSITLPGLSISLSFG
ncbi:MAG TPA: DUF6230 family protein [Ktedonobacteraceae bacterium]